MLRILLVFSGMISVILGVLGIFLPLLPTTPFLLLASACFVKSSPRFHYWLITHKTLGPVIQNWQTHRAVSSTVRRRGAAAIIISFSWSIWVVPLIWLKITLFLGLLLALTFFLRLPVNDPVD